MSRVAWAGFLTTVLVAISGRLHAQYCFSDSTSQEASGAKEPKLVYSPDSVSQLAVQLAPTLRFGPGETYFPTMPFFRAFDSRENAGGTWTTDNLDYIANLRADGTVSWNTLDSTYALRQKPQHFSDVQLDSVPIPTTTAVFFRADCLDRGASERVWQFLQNDAQAWMRSRAIRDLYFRNNLYRAVFQVLQYYFHYVNDTGLEGHPGDLEAVFVFVPRARGDTSGAQPKTSSLDDLLIIVGQGHSASTPNNVLVLTGQEARHVRARGWHSMVELGGHSSAPDRNRDGLFSPGFDANWNIGEKMWGTRDAQALSGTGYLGKYESWMTLPRSYWYSVTLEKDTNNLARLQRTRGESPRLEPGAGRAGDRGYILAPVRLVRELYEALDAVPDSGPLAVPDSLRTTIVGLVNDSLAPLLEPWGFKGFAPKLVPPAYDTIIRRMRLWTREPTWRTDGGQGGDLIDLLLPILRPDQDAIPLARFQVWRNRAATQTSDRILKASLFRPTVTLPSEHGAPARGSIRQLGYMVYEADLSPGGPVGVLAGVLLPYFVPLRLATRALDTPGIFEYKAGLYFGLRSADRIRPAISVSYDRHYKSFVSWSLAYNWVYHRRHFEPGATSSALILGASFMPFYPFADSKLLGPPATHVRVRTGVRLEIRSWRPVARRLSLQVLYYYR